MAGLEDLLNSDLGKNLISTASQQLGQPKNKTASALSTALPLILGGLQKNASTPEGAQGIMNALNSKHDGSILDNLGGLIDNSDILKDGAGILGHVFGGKTQNVANAVSTKSGLDVNTTMSLLKMAAPIVMGYLGKQTSNQQTDENGINNLLGGLLGENGSQSLLTKILDADGDGDVMDDIMDMATGKSKGGLGGLLGGLFGEK